MLDYVIRGGQVVTPGGVGEWDIGVRGEKIVAVAESEALTESVGRVIDASGKIVRHLTCFPHVARSLSEPSGAGVNVRAAPLSSRARREAGDPMQMGRIVARRKPVGVARSSREPGS